MRAIAPNNLHRARLSRLDRKAIDDAMYGNDGRKDSFVAFKGEHKLAAVLAAESHTPRLIEIRLRGGLLRRLSGGQQKIFRRDGAGKQHTKRDGLQVSLRVSHPGQNS